MQARDVVNEERDYLEYWLQILVGVCAVLGGLMVDLGRGTAAFSPILATCAIAPWIVTDWRGWIRLPRPLVGVITLGAVFPLAQGFLQYDTTSQLTEISRLLTIWLGVMFFQAKTPRVYGSLIVLSLLLVVVAAILNNGMFFALLLIIYQFGGMLSLVLLYVHSGRLAVRLAFDEARARIRQEAANSRGAVADLLGRPPVAYQQPSSLPNRGRMWDRGLVVHLVGMVFTTMAFAIGFFYTVPRLGEGGWGSSTVASTTQVGFSSEVSFEEMGNILESDELAFRVALTDARTGEPYQVFGEPYFQGKALAFYDIDSRGRSAWRSYARSQGRPLFPIDANYEGDLVRQDYVMGPAKDGTLFFLPAPFAGANTSSLLRFDRFTGRVFRPENIDTGFQRSFRYSIYTTGFRNRTQLPLTPVLRYDPRNRQVYRRIAPEEKAGLLVFEEARFPGLAALARELVGKDEPNHNPVYMARILTNHFHDTTRYRYTLDFREVEEKRNHLLDPVEDFVVNHHTGHCEYFASALALMLRSVGIPSRVIVGYLGGDFNELGQYYQIHQYHAHAWVEMYLEPEQVPRGMMSQAISEGGAAWYRLDPTPAAALDDQNIRPASRAFDKILDYAQLVWQDYVLEVDPERQRTGVSAATEERESFLARVPVIGPMAKMVYAWWKTGPEAFLAAWRKEGWWNWRGGVVASFFATLFFALTAAVRQGRHWLAARRGPRKREWEFSRHRIDFYRRLEEILERQGLRRLPSQTPSEFIETVAQSLESGSADQPATSHLESDSIARVRLHSALESLVATFYRVRFGGAEVDAMQRQSIDSWLADCQAALTRPSPPRARS